MKKYLYLLTVIVTFSACHRNDFTVTGNVSDAEGKTTPCFAAKEAYAGEWGYLKK